MLLEHFTFQFCNSFQNEHFFSTALFPNIKCKTASPDASLELYLVLNALFVKLIYLLHHQFSTLTGHVLGLLIPLALVTVSMWENPSCMNVEFLAPFHKFNFNFSKF